MQQSLWCITALPKGAALWSGVVRTNAPKLKLSDDSKSQTGVSVTFSFNRGDRGTAVAVATQKQTAAVEGWGHSRSVSFLGCVMSALLLKIAQHRTTGGSFRVKQGMLDEPGSMWWLWGELPKNKEVEGNRHICVISGVRVDACGTKKSMRKKKSI